MTDAGAAAGPVRVRAAWALVLLVVAALEFVPSYRGVVAPIAFVFAAAVPFGSVRLGQLVRLGTFGAALVTIVAASVAGWVVLHRASTSSLGGLGDALPRLLTTPRPADATATLLTPALLLVALVSTVVAACVLADARPGRIGGLLAPVVGTAAVYLPAQLLAAGAADPHGIVAACLVVVVAAGWSLPAVRGGARQGVVRRGAVVPIACAAAVALAAAAACTATTPFDPRRHVRPPTVRIRAESPLALLSSWAANPSVPILRTTVKGTPRLHLATLSTFTGDSWQVNERYQQLGLVASGDLPGPAQRASVSGTVRIERLSGVWLPAPGVATSASPDDILIDPDDGTLARPQHVHAGLTYDVHATVPTPSSQQLSVAAVPSSVPRRYLALPGAPAGFKQYAQEAVRGASTALEEAVALEHAVSTGRIVAPQSPTGSSYGRLQTFLFGARGAAGAQAGTEEQFAAAFAVLGREVGLPTRLVVGFLLGRPDASGTITVHGRDATVWPEVYLAGVGWVPFAPTPGDDGTGADSSLRQSVLQRLSKEVEQLPKQDPVAPATQHSAAPRAGTHASSAPTAASGSMPTWLLVVLAVLLVLALLLVVLALLRALRSARHRRQGPLGAWAEVVDLLVLIGRRPVVSAAAPDVATEASATLGRFAVPIAHAADRAAFAPPPGSATGAGNEPAPDVWRDVRVVRRHARATLPRRRRVLLPVDPRPLLNRRR